MKSIYQSTLLTLLMVASSVLAELPPAPPSTFSIAVIPDTQHYRGKGTKAQPNSNDPVTNTVFDAYTTWIAANLEAQRIVFVSHVGDIVDKNVPKQWIVAQRAMDRLHGRIPYGISVGNHDMTREGDSSLFQSYFPESRFADRSWYGGTYPASNPQISGNNANSYQLFSAAGIDFVFLHLECNAPDVVLSWVSDILDRYSDRTAFITTHMGLGPLNKPKESAGYYVDPKGLMQWTKRHEDRGNSPQQMWDECFKKQAISSPCSAGTKAELKVCMWQDRRMMDTGSTTSSPTTAPTACAFIGLRHQKIAST